MAVGDKVVFPLIASGAPIVALNVPSCNQCGCLPLVGTVLSDDGSVLGISWPNGQEASGVPVGLVQRISDRSAFPNAAAQSWFDDIGKYVQITDYPYADFRRVTKETEGVDPGPRSPAASGLIVQVYGLQDYNSEDDPEYVVAWIALQNGRKHAFVFGTDVFDPVVAAWKKPYRVDPGRRSVGFGS